MGLTKQYLAYRPVETFNVINSGRANVNFLIYKQIEGRYVLTAAAENAIVWDLRLGERVLTLRRDKQEVTALRASPDRTHVAVGYADGVVALFDLEAAEAATSTLALHKSAVAILRFDANGMRLISGGLDTELVVVDMVELAGRQRLIGHNAPVTDAHFLQHFGENDVVVSCSKDMQIKFWNLQTQFCFKTIVDNRTEVWSLAFIGDLMLAGCGETSINVYRLRQKQQVEQSIEAAIEDLCIDVEDTISTFSVSNVGVIERGGRGRTVSMVVDAAERVLSCHGTNDLIENFYFCTEAEARQRLAKRLKKAKKQQEQAAPNDTELANTSLSLSDVVKRLESIKVKQKIKCIDVLLGANDELRVLVSLANNSLQLYGLLASSKGKTQEQSNVKLLRALTRMGHQSEVRAVCFSSDSLAIGSAAGDSFKFWNRESLQCLRTVSTGYALCCCFVPGDRYALLGLKTGALLIINVGTGDLVEEIAAHEKELWSICLLPDRKGCVTGSGDATVKIWLFELIDSNAKKDADDDDDSAAVTQNKVLSLLHKNTLKLEETVLCVRISPDMKYLAASLLDSTVKVFFLDSFKFYLSLYGHKLPVLCLDISYDSTLIVTGSTDRNIKIWGLDFGDCHRSLFAHDDSVMSLQFIPKTHMFFSCGKDGGIKQWDADNFEKILTLPGHIGEAHGLAVSPNGMFLITCGSDRTLRLFERTDETIVLQDVQEEEREEIENQKLATGEDNAVPLMPGLKLPSRKTVGAEKAADSILECLDICKKRDAEDDAMQEPHPLMRALNVQNHVDFVLITLSRIRASDLEEALLLLPFSDVCVLLTYLLQLIEQRTDELELLTKVTTFLFKVHMKPITSSKALKPTLERIVKALKTDIQAMRDVIGFNMHALALLQRDIETREGVELFYEATQQRKKHDKKRREATKRTLIQMSQ